MLCKSLLIPYLEMYLFFIIVSLVYLRHQTNFNWITDNETNSPDATMSLHLIRIVRIRNQDTKCIFFGFLFFVPFVCYDTNLFSIMFFLVGFVDVCREMSE